MPSYGDRSLAIRMVGLTGGIPVVLDIVLVADGRTGISVMAGGVSPVSSQELRMFVTKPLAKLHCLTATYALRSHCQAPARRRSHAQGCVHIRSCRTPGGHVCRICRVGWGDGP